MKASLAPARPRSPKNSNAGATTVVHGDRKFAYYGDLESGERLDWPNHTTEAEAVEWGYWHWVWPVDKVRSIIADHHHPMTFFCGGSRNRHRFVDLFDTVFVLEIDPGTLNGRLLTRPEDVFGGKPIERELTLRQLKTREDIPSNAFSIDSTMPIGQVVDAILSKCG